MWFIEPTKLQLKGARKQLTDFKFSLKSENSEFCEQSKFFEFSEVAACQSATRYVFRKFTVLAKFAVFGFVHVADCHVAAWGIGLSLLYHCIEVPNPQRSAAIDENNTISKITY